MSRAVKRNATPAGPAGWRTLYNRVVAMREAMETPVDVIGCDKLADATQLCAQHLKAHGPSAEAFYLMGLVHDADGRPAEAVEFYRKAIYLDPVHHEALVQLALLRERLGDHAAAQALNERARKAALKLTK